VLPGVAWVTLSRIGGAVRVGGKARGVARRSAERRKRCGAEAVRCWCWAYCRAKAETIRANFLETQTTFFKQLISFFPIANVFVCITLQFHVSE
tara:strand:+ start:836 stop:1117 length:282 start_codon:yes stop_codon:yes gene_type:complete